MNMRLISVVMSVRNGEEYLCQSIESILCQSYNHFEFIIIDDASEDQTNTICRRYKKKDPRIMFYKNAKHLGLTGSLNKGVRLARGKYIARMDADDVSAPTRFEKQIHFLENNRSCKLLGSRGYFADATGRKQWIIATPLTDQAIRKTMFQDNPFIHSSVMFERKAALECGLYDEDFKRAQDYEFWCRILLFHEGANLEEPLICWRENKNGISVAKLQEQRLFADAVIGRYQSLYREIEKFQGTADERKNTLQIEMMQLFCRRNPGLFKVFCDAWNKANCMSPQDKLTVMNRLLAVSSNLAEKTILKEIEKILSVFSVKSPESEYQRASVLKRLGKIGQALKVFDSLYEKASADFKAKIAFHLGEIYFSKRQNKKAKEFFKETVAMIPDHIKAKGYLEVI